jgi:hypothetical protein
MIRQSVAAAGVVASLAFVGLQIRQSNIQARAAAYQAIGIATSEFHRGFDARMNRLTTESDYPEAVKRWTLEDWERMERMFTADLRHAGDQSCFRSIRACFPLTLQPGLDMTGVRS